MKRAYLLLLLMLLAPGLLFGVIPVVEAQGNLELRIDEIQSDSFPDLTLNLSTLDAQGYPIPGLAAGNFTLSEDGNVVSNFKVTSIQQHPIQVVLVIDTTQSMQYGPKPTPLESIAVAATQFFGGLGTQDKVAVLSFSDQVQVLQDLTDNKVNAQAALNSLSIGFSTKLNDALMQAAGLLQGQALRPVIIFVTDGTDSGASQVSFDQALQSISALRGVVFPIGWGGAKKDNLEELAKLTHGESQFLQGQTPDATAIQAAFNHVLNLLPEYRTQYQITYQSTLPADGKEHVIAVGFNQLGVHLEQTRRFVATQHEIFLTFPTLTDGQTVGGKIDFAPQVNAPAPLQKIEILVDGQPLTSLVAEPFALQWDSTQVVAGEHEFKFIAHDTAGNSGETLLKLNIVAPITVAITSPQDGSQVQGSVPISVQVDSLAKIARVEFQVDGNLLATIQNPPFEYSWPSARASEGGHEISVTAYDVNGFSANHSVRITTGSGNGGLLGGPGGIALAVALAAVVLMVPLVLRVRRQRKATNPIPEAAIGTILAPAEAGLPSGNGAILQEVEGLNPGQKWNIPQSGDVSLGRKRDENDIPLKGPTASRRHAVIRMQEGRYYLVNLRPENPIYVNGNPVVQQCPLNPGDTLQAGESIFQFDQQA
jgi:uncharacterized protein YegL